MVSGEKRNCEGENALERITTILLDIEGTTTSISFVKDVLFPYVRENLKNYVNEHWNDEEFKADLKALKLQAKKDEEEKVENFCPIEEGDNEKESLMKNVLWQMDLDRKTTALKQLQGHIWREGYESGKLKGHVYPEVAQIFKKWSEDGRKLYIYSSGSVEAQKLLFKNSESGDLSGFLSGYFDTEIGPKTEASSYTSIVKAVGCDSGQVLFFTDVVKEAVAADKAGLQVMIVLREGNAPLSEDEIKAFSTVSTFKDVVFESSNKKKKICDEESAKAPAENDKTKEEPMEVKNGETEMMEMEPTEPKPDDSNVEKAEENGETKMEADAGPETTESDNADVDVDDSNVEKIISSSEAETAPVSEEIEKPSEEVSQTADSTEDNQTEANAVEEEPATEEEKVEEEKSVNGHENGDAKDNNEKTEAEEANGKVEEEIEAVPVKKVSSDEQADSTVEVTA